MITVKSSFLSPFFLGCLFRRGRTGLVELEIVTHFEICILSTGAHGGRLGGDGDGVGGGGRRGG